MTVNRSQILVIEDSKADAILIREAIETAAIDADLHFVQDGQKATQFFDAADADPNAPCPDLVLLDLNLPRKSGTEVLAHMRRSQACRDALVVVVSSSETPRDREAVNALGADGYFRKPSEYSEFLKLGPVAKSLLEQRAGKKGR